jgi:hypothetical protein
VKLKLPNALSLSSWRNTIWYLTVKQDAVLLSGLIN